MTPPSRRAAINSSASHVFEVLRFVAEAAEPLGVTEIARRLNLPASTVHRALVTLEEANYIQRYQNTPCFELGMMPHLLNRALLNHFALHSYSRPQLHALAAETGHTVSLWYRLGWYGIRIGGAFGSQDIHHRARLGETDLLHRGPGPAAILAYLSSSERQAYARFAKAKFPELPPIGGWEEIEDRLAGLRTRGFARQSLPIARDFHAVALPIYDAREQVVGSLMMEGEFDEVNPSQEMHKAREDIEAGLRAEPKRFESPFSHIDVDEIYIRIIDSNDQP